MAQVGVALLSLLVFLGCTSPFLTRDRRKQELWAMRAWVLIPVALAILLVAVLLFRLTSAIDP